jgi:sporulation protein YabP
MNDMKQPQSTVRHELCVKDRRTMSVSGVKEIISFDEQNVRMLTVGGELVVDGESLRVKVLDVERGQVVLEGRIDDVGYVEDHTEARRGFWSRLIK